MVMIALVTIFRR